MDEHEKRPLPESTDNEGQVPGTYPAHSSTSLVSRRGLIMAIATFIVCGFVLTGPLLSTPSASSSHPGTYLRAILGHSLSDWLGVWNGDAHQRPQPWNAVANEWPGYPYKPSACPAPPPNLLSHNPIRPGNVTPRIQAALDLLHRHLLLETFNRRNDIDSLAIAVVTPAGPIFEQGYGILKANDTSGKQYPVDKHSIYRIASISKMFAVFETLLLRERGALEFDDPVDKYIPEFRPPGADRDWPEYLRGREDDLDEEYSSRSSRITLRQLASHTSGLGRDYPTQNFTKWPIEAKDFPEISDSRNASKDAVLDGTAEYPLLNLPYAYPIYSNAGFDLLGLANVAANLKLKGGFAKEEPQTYKELVKRDVFDPFGLNSSFFRLPRDQDMKDHIAIPHKFPRWADSSFGDADDSAGGQYSSLADLAKIAQVFLSPKAPNKEHRFLPALMREWLRPVHIWPDGNEAVGAPWEISYLPPTNLFGDIRQGSRHFPEPDFYRQLDLLNYGMSGGLYPYPGRVPIYSKSGSIPGYQSLFSLNPEFGYAVIVLTTGSDPQPATIVYDALQKLQPVFQEQLLNQVVETYVGTWEAERGGQGSKDVAEVGVLQGQLFLKQLVIDGLDVLKSIREAIGTGEPHQTLPIPLWSTGRLHEFRLAPGLVPKDGRGDMTSCMSYWVTIEYPRVFARGASIGLVYWEDGELVYPSGGVRFKRKTPVRRCGTQFVDSSYGLYEGY